MLHSVSRGTNFSSGTNHLIIVTASGSTGGPRNGSRRSAATADDERGTTTSNRTARISDDSVRFVSTREFRSSHPDERRRRHAIRRGRQRIVESGKTGRNDRRVKGSDNSRIVVYSGYSSRTVVYGGDNSRIVGNGGQQHMETGITVVRRRLVYCSSLITFN